MQMHVKINKNVYKYLQKYNYLQEFYYRPTAVAIATAKAAVASQMHSRNTFG